MKTKKLFSALLIFGFLSVVYSQDTIFLNDVKILKSSFKKSKVISIKKGFKNNFCEAGYLRNQDFLLFHKVSFPLGQPLEITLYFSSHGDFKPTVNNYTIEKAQYEFDVFEVDPDGNVGKRLTDEPFLLKFDEEKKSAWQQVKRVISLQDLNLFGNSFFVRLNSSFLEKCKSCHHYYSLGERLDGVSSTKFIKKSNLENGKDIWQNWDFNLRYKLKVFTNEY